jgi:hypothetical protein
MYHHFQDFNDLLEHAQVARFASYVDNSIEMISKLLVLKTKEEFVQGLKDVTRYTQSDLLKSQRLYRATAISRAGVSERMRVHLGEEQSRLTASLGDLYHEVLNRGWGNPNLKPQTLAVFIQAYTLGIIVNDYVDDQMDLENWFWLVDHFMSDIALKAD